MEKRSWKRYSSDAVSLAFEPSANMQSHTVDVVSACSLSHSDTPATPSTGEVISSGKYARDTTARMGCAIRFKLPAIAKNHIGDRATRYPLCSPIAARIQTQRHIRLKTTKKFSGHAGRPSSAGKRSSNRVTNSSMKWRHGAASPDQKEAHRSFMAGEIAACGLTQNRPLLQRLLIVRPSPRPYCAGFHSPSVPVTSWRSAATRHSSAGTWRFRRSGRPSFRLGSRRLGHARFVGHGPPSSHPV